MNNIANIELLCSLITTSKNFNYTLLKEQIITNQISWNQIVAVANKEYLIPILYISLKNRGLFDILQDEQLKEYLQTVYQFNLQRNESIIVQIVDLISTLKLSNITPLLLKGSVSLCENDYTDLGMRHLTDIDIMIKPEQMKKAFNILMDSGYYFVKEEDSNEPGLNPLNGKFLHVKPIAKNGMPSSVELHHAILVKSASSHMTDYTNHIAECSYENLSHVDIFTPTYRVYHAFLHTELQDKNHSFRRITLRHLYDFTVLVNKYKSEIDWKLINKLVNKNNSKYILDDYLYLVKMFFSLDTPLTVENEKTVRHYKRVLKVIQLEGTILENFYPISAHLPKIFGAYSYRRLQSIYSFDSNFGYVFAIIKRFFFHVKLMSRYFTS